MCFCVIEMSELKVIKFVVKLVLNEIGVVFLDISVMKNGEMNVVFVVENV